MRLFERHVHRRGNFACDEHRQQTRHSVICHQLHEANRRDFRLSGAEYSECEMHARNYHAVEAAALAETNASSFRERLEARAEVATIDSERDVPNSRRNPWIISAAAMLVLLFATPIVHGEVVVDDSGPSTLIINSDDAARGYLDVAYGSAVLADPGDVLEFKLDANDRSVVSGVTVTWGDRVVQVHPGESLPVADAAASAASELRFRYRLELAPGTLPGVYDWPLHVAAADGER